MHVENMRSSMGHEVPNQFIVDNGMGTVYFQSYKSIIATKGMAGLKLDAGKWNYSRTTSKYRNIFTGLSTKETKEKIKSGEIKLVNLN